MGDEAYFQIAKIIDESALGAPKSGGEFSKAFIEYLKLLYKPEEAELVRHLRMPSRFKNTDQIAREAGKDKSEVSKILDNLAKKNFIMGMGGMYSMLTIPGLMNAHQFYEEVKPDNLEAARLYKDFFIKEGYYKYYETSEKGTPMMRTITVNRTIEDAQKVLDVEEAHKVIMDNPMDNVALVPCPCRTRTEKMVTRECSDRNPIGACIMVGPAGMHFPNVGLGKKVTKEQAIEYLDEMQDLGLVAITDNYKAPSHTVICLCCECCCSQTRGRTVWDNPTAIAPNNFVPEAGDECTLCGKCADRCFFDAITVDRNISDRATVEIDKCLGCGVCTITCKPKALKLRRVERNEIFETPKDLYRRIAIENKGEQTK